MVRCWAISNNDTDSEATSFRNRSDEEELELRTQVLLNPNGSGGDVYPFLAVGKQLQRLGHHVGVMTNPLFKERVGEAGLEFIPLGSEEELNRVGQSLTSLPKSRIWEVALRWTAESAAQAVDYLEQRRTRYPTMLVGSPLSFGMRLIAEKYQVPSATLVLSPYVLRSVMASPVVPPLFLHDWMPKWLKRLQFWAADRWGIDRVIGPILGPLRRQLALEPRTRFLHDWCMGPDLVLGCFPEWFAPVQRDWPCTFQHVGPIHWEPSTLGQKRGPNREADFTELHCADANRPPIAILAGSGGAPSQDFYRVWISASEAMGRGLVIIEKDLAMLPSALPEHVQVVPYYPLEQLLRQVSILIHSGSIGATLRCAAAGIPQLVFPRFNDQFDNAARVRQLGIGTVLKPAALRRLDGDLATARLTRLFNNARLQQQCQAVANRPHTDGASLAAQLIDQVFRRRVQAT